MTALAPPPVSTVAQPARFVGNVASRTVLGLIAFGAILATLAGLVNEPWPIPPVALIAHISGLLGGYGAAVVLILVSRTPVLENRIGADRLTRWHAFGGRWTLILVLIHAVFAVFAVAAATRRSPGDAVGIVLGLPDIVPAVIGTVLMIVAGVASARAARKRLRYETWHAIHLMMYVGVALGFAHEIAGPDLAGRRVEQIAWTALYTVAFALLLRFRILAPLFVAARHHLRVVSVVTEGPGVVTITIRGKHLDELGATAGQFFRWRFLTGATWMSAHPISLSAAPTDDTLRITVKEVGDGTRKLRRLAPGTRVLAEGPYGAMTAACRHGRGVLLLAGGIGITPMRALLESLPHDSGPVTLIYRTSSDDDVLFRHELDALAADRDATVEYVTGHTGEPGTAITASRLAQLVPDLEQRDVYICASERFGGHLRAVLADAGVPRGHIHYEEFSF